MNTKAMQIILDVAKNTPLEEFKINLWLTSCGTYGCLIGKAAEKLHELDPNFCLTRTNENHSYLPTYKSKEQLTAFVMLSEFLDIPLKDVKILFGTTLIPGSERSVLKRISALKTYIKEHSS